MKLSQDFELEEFLQSQVAARSGIRLEPPQVVIENLRQLCVLVLQPIRDALDKPITITSGYRPVWLNNIIRGAPNSAHITGLAADIKVRGMSARELAEAIRGLGLPLDKCLLEFPASGGWVHVQIAKPGASPRQQFLTASREGGKTIYREGLHA